jgi:hypothetical protein
MKITLESEYGKYEIEVPGNDLDVNDVVESLLKPVMLAAGYHPDNVNDVFYHEEAN